MTHDRTQSEIEEMETATDLDRDKHAPNCNKQHRFIGTCPIVDNVEPEQVCPICEKIIGDEWNKCLCLHEGVH